MYRLVLLVSAGVFVFAGVWVPDAWARGPEVTPDEYQLYMDWKDGREDPRLAKFEEGAKLRKIAKNLGVKQTVLKAAISKVEPMAPTLAADTTKAIKKSLDETVMKGRVSNVEVGADQGHVVVGVKWRCGDARDFEKEAAYVAWAVADGGPVVKTLALWCVNGADTKLFSAKIGRTGFTRISRGGIDRFASTRYIKLFEAVRRGPHK